MVKHELKLRFGEIDASISIMREVSRWGKEKGFRIWPEEWLTREELLRGDVRPEDFCLGVEDDKPVCTFILQRQDSEYWPDALYGEAVYLHKLCVLHRKNHKEQTKRIIETLCTFCRKEGIRYIRLDTAMDEEKVKSIYLNAGFQIVKIIDCHNGRYMALYEREV